MSVRNFKLPVSVCLILSLSVFLISALRPSSYPWLRISSPMYNMKISTNGEFIAFTDKAGFNLKVLETVSKNVFLVTEGMVQGSFLWSNDNCTLFYTEFSKNPLKTAKSKVQTSLKTYSCSEKTSQFIESYGDAKSFLSYAPRSKTLSIMGDGLVHQKKIILEGQKPSKLESISWIVTQRGVYRLSKDSQSLVRMVDDDSGISSYDVSFDGQKIIWATKSGSIYVAGDGSSRLLTYGLDPSWNPKASMFVFVGKREGISEEYDVKISDLDGNERFLTASMGLKERFPLWYKKSKISYTIENSTDLFMIEFLKEEDPLDNRLSLEYKNLPDDQVEKKESETDKYRGKQVENIDIDTEEPFLEDDMYDEFEREDEIELKKKNIY